MAFVRVTNISKQVCLGSTSSLGIGLAEQSGLNTCGQSNFVSSAKNYGLPVWPRIRGKVSSSALPWK